MPAFDSIPSRRSFLRAATLGSAAFAMNPPSFGFSRGSADFRCIVLFLVGGPSQLETWDPKPAAPSTIRGPFRPIHTNVPGIDISEHFPRMARLADKYAIVRSVHHREMPIHELGQQLLQTGHFVNNGPDYPHIGSVLSHLRGPSINGLPNTVILPAPIADTGVRIGHGQSAASLGREHEPYSPSPEFKQRLLATQSTADLRRYGSTTFGNDCLLARLLVERGVQFVTVNMFDTIFHRLSWDCHADGAALPTTLNDYRETICPTFDCAYSSLIDDLDRRGLLSTTLVVAMGELGRSPRLNAAGGRDHHPGVFSILFAGAGVRGGQVIGSSDQHGSEPRDLPIAPAQIAASIYQTLGGVAPSFGSQGALTGPGTGDSTPLRL